MLMKRFLGLLPAFALAALSTAALPTAATAEPIKIGFVTTLTTGAAVIGKDQQNAVELALDHMGRKMGGRDVVIVYGDDEFNPQKGKQKTEKLVKRDNVDIVAGYIWSHVLLASKAPVLDAGLILISANAGPSPLAGESCDKNFFNISWQNDQTPMALGEVLNRKGVKSLYIMTPNYAAGKNMVAGVERTFKGEIVGKDMTKWPTQIDWAAAMSSAIPPRAPPRPRSRALMGQGLRISKTRKAMNPSPKASGSSPAGATASIWPATSSMTMAPGSRSGVWAR